jgi:hypothetical protein
MQDGCAVVTDAVSAGFYVLAWQKYLLAFAEQRPDVTICARGFDVLRKIDEPELDYSAPMFGAQHRHAFTIISLKIYRLS